MGMNRKQQEDFYNEIVRLYDFADGIMDAIEAEGVQNANAQAEIAMPLVNQVNHSADSLTETYLDHLETGQNVPESRLMARIEGATRKIFTQIAQTSQKLQKIATPEQVEPLAQEALPEPADKDAILLHLQDAVTRGGDVGQDIAWLSDHLPKSTIQNALLGDAKRLGRFYGGLLARAVRKLGEHMLALMHVLQALGLGTVVKAVPNRARLSVTQMLSLRLSNQAATVDVRGY